MVEKEAEKKKNLIDDVSSLNIVIIFKTIAKIAKKMSQKHF